MGCGVSSANTNDSTVPRTISSGESQDQPDEQPFDRENALRNFNNLENAINVLEETKCFEQHRVISEDLDLLNQQLHNYTEAANRTNSQIIQLIDSNKLSNETSLRELVMENWSQQVRTKINSKDASTIELLNSQEMIDIKTELTQKDIERLTVESAELKVPCDQLQDLYRQRDAILRSYANDKEMQLERDLDELMEERHLVEVGNFRWTNTSKLISEALKCLDSALDKLQQYNNITDSDLNYKYTCIQEARNSLTIYMYKVVFLQNILINIKLPHVTSDDLEQLDKRNNQLYVDTFGSNKLEQTHEFVRSLRVKTVTQYKWIKEVLNKTINHDLLEIRERCLNKIHELRFERATQIRQNIEQNPVDSELTNIEQQPNGNKVDSPFDLRGKSLHSSSTRPKRTIDSGVDSELDDSLTTDEYVARMFTSGKHSQLSNGTPLLPGEELGPIPSDREIFGKINELRNKHSREFAEFMQIQQINKDRVAQGLRDKLNNRRSRRSRMEMHKRQLEALQESPYN